ncbi:MAG: enoyl-CoA hydratase-related protein, partial [Gemmatimonadota bacterium]
MDPSIRTTVEDGVLTVTLDRPEKRNALNGAVIDGLTAALREAVDDGSVRIVLLRAEGADFCAGADLESL